LPDISTIQDQIRDRLAEVEKLIEPLRAEAEQLTQMAATFAAGAASAVTSHTPARAATPRKASTRKPRATTTTTAAAKTGGAKRGRPLGSGNRAQQAVAKIIEQPGITASELAKSMGISPNYLYRVLPRLEREAKVVKQGRGYHPATGDVDADAAAANGQPVAA
jgi:cell division septum initiation protein DivIVA